MLGTLIDVRGAEFSCARNFDRRAWIFEKMQIVRLKPGHDSYHAAIFISHRRTILGERTRVVAGTGWKRPLTNERESTVGHCASPFQSRLRSPSRIILTNFDRRYNKSMEEYCLNSRWWIEFMLPRPPKSCPYSAAASGYQCVGDKCGYYEQREPTPHFREKREELRKLCEEL